MSDDTRVSADEAALYAQIGRELAAMADPLFVELTPRGLFTIAGLVTLAAKHPAVVSADVRGTAATFVEAARRTFAGCPGILEVMARGDVSSAIGAALLERAATMVSSGAPVNELPLDGPLLEARIRLIATFTALPREAFNFFCAIAVNLVAAIDVTAQQHGGVVLARPALERFAEVARRYLEADETAGRSTTGPTIEPHTPSNRTH